MIILVLHGPNLGILGNREPEIYGDKSLVQLNAIMHQEADKYKVVLKVFQSNHEGKLIDMIEENTEISDAIIINPGGLAHTSVVLMDALKAYGKPVIEVHLSDTSKREEFRKHSYVGMIAEKSFVGMGVVSYTEAIRHLATSDLSKIQKPFI